jgi:hypothetical protein
MTYAVVQPSVQESFLDQLEAAGYQANKLSVWAVQVSHRQCALYQRELQHVEQMRV